MKAKKMLLPIIIWGVAILAIAAYAVGFSVAKKPVITEGEFDFSIKYEFDGETITINDTYTVCYVKNGGYGNSRTRIYEGTFGNKQDATRTTYVLQDDTNGCIVLETNFCAACLMGDPEYDHSIDELKPQFIYDDPNGMRYFDDETLLAQGVKLVSWEYPTPIKNTFVFSHMSILSGDVILPMLLIGLLALLATIIFVKKDKDFVSKPIDLISAVFNFLVGFIALPFMTFCTLLFEINAENGHIFHQMLYFVPAFAALCIAASTGLRRKGFGKSGLIVQFAGPVVFVLLVVLVDLVASNY